MNGAVLRSRSLVLVTTPLCVAAALASVVGVPLLAVAMIRATGSTADLVGATSQALQLGQVCAVVLAAALLGEQYDGAGLRTALLGAPRRAGLLASTLLVLLLAVVVCYVLAVTAGTLAARAAGAPGPGWGWVDAPMLVRGLASWWGIALLSAALTVVARSLILPVAVLVPLLLGLSRVVQGLLPAARVLPDLATYAAFVPEASGPLLSPGTGTAVQWLWVLAVGALAWLRYRRHEVR